MTKLSPKELNQRIDKLTDWLEMPTHPLTVGFEKEVRQLVRDCIESVIPLGTLTIYTVAGLPSEELVPLSSLRKNIEEVLGDG